jgi:FGGY-family pentulose kinase
MGDLLVGVDVGTGSARAGVLSGRGVLLGRAEHPIAMRRSSAQRAEHDSEDIWQAVAMAVRGALAEAGAPPEAIASIGFDATCSLVVRDRAGAPLPVSPDGEPRWDTIVWLDHRAMAEAEACTATGDPVLGHFGGVMSPEMQLPKLMWLKRHVPPTWAAMGHAFDLVDFLTWKATGSPARSQSSLAAKWGWGCGETAGWPRDFFGRLGLGEVIERSGLPDAPAPPGSDLGPLTAEAARQLGLGSGVRVAAGLVDAHAGALAVLGARARQPDELDRHLCLIAGTSNSILALAPDARPARGVWGPYPGAVLPGAWLLEAGQSATGAVLDHLIRWHRAGGESTPERHQAIAQRITELRAAEGPHFAARLHVLPDFHGNRSPLAEPAALGVVSGLGLDSDFDSLCRLYWRAAVAVALGVRQNLEALAARGFDAGTLLLGGGHARNRLLLDLYADATGATVIESKAPEAMLLGSAMLAATAAGLHPGLAEAAAAMDQGGTARRPDPSVTAGFDRDYRILLEMQRQRRVIEAM